MQLAVEALQAKGRAWPAVAAAGLGVVMAMAVVQLSHAATEPLPCGPTTLEASPSHVALPAVKVPSGALPGTAISGATAEKIGALAPHGVTFSVTDMVWLVDGARAGFGPTYTVRQKDLGKSIVQTAALTWSQPCRAHSLIATAPAVTILGGSKVSLRRSLARPTAVTFRVTPRSTTHIAGFVKVSWTGAQKGHRVVAVKGRKPSATVRLPVRLRGSVTVRAEFVDTTGRSPIR